MQTVVKIVFVVAILGAISVSSALAQNGPEPSTKTSESKDGVKDTLPPAVGVRDTLAPVISVRDTLAPVISWRQKVSGETAMKVMNEVKKKLGPKAAQKLEQAKSLKKFRRILAATAKQCATCSQVKALSTQLAVPTKPAGKK